MNQINAINPQLNRIQQIALVVGLLGIVAGTAGFFISREQFFQSYLLGFIFWVHVGLGCIGLVMIQHLTGGRWGFTIRRLLESGAMTLPLMALLFVPILFGIPQLYLWARPEEVAHSELLQHKAPYLNVPFFVARTVLYFVIWVVLAYLLNRWSARQDETGEAGLSDRLKKLSAPGLILFALTATFAAFDWLMSLEPEWFSSIYGVIFMAGQALVAIALTIVLGSLLSRLGSFSKWMSIDIFNDLGNFMLAFVSFWAYVAYSQYLIIWSANIPEEITFYVRRSQGGWEWVAMALIVFHFALPFAVLLSRKAKRTVKLLVALAIMLMVMRLVDFTFLIGPAFSPTFQFHWLNLVSVIGIGGVWLAFFIWQLKKKSLIPLHDPNYQEAPAHD